MRLEFYPDSSDPDNKKGTLTVASLPWTKTLCFIIRHSVILNSRQKTEKHVGLPEWDLFIGKDHYAKVFRMCTRQ